MRKLMFMLFLVCSGLMFGQMGKVAERVQELNMMNQTFTKYQVFTKNLDAEKKMKYERSATDATVLDLNSVELNRILAESPQYLSMKVPYMNENIEVQMYKQEVTTDSFYAIDESGNFLDYTPGVYYRGIVNGDYSSLVAVSFFENEVIGVISTDEKGNVVLGKSVDGKDFVSYSDRNLLGENPFMCGVDDLELNQQVEKQINHQPELELDFMPNTENCVRIYYEIAYSPFVMKGKNVTLTLNWITGIQNNIGTLYDNDGVNMAISQVKIWTYQDPYTGAYGDNLYLFRDLVTDFDGDLGHLVNQPSTTSVAFLDSLCTNYNYAYSGISMSYQQVPTYSWTIMAMTHEMGHSLGSPHTHACAWNGNNTAIDGCGNQAGYGEGCNGPIPNGGGTIMSYCHLTSTGISLNKGFGEQPGQLIRTKVDSKPCLSSDCSAEMSVCTYAVQKVSVNHIGDVAQITVTDPYSATWAYKVVPFGTNPGTTGWTTTTTKVFQIYDIPPHVYHEIYVKNVCEDGTEGSMKKSIILVGDFCDGTLFTDTGGQNGPYGNNQYFVKTFYPSTEDGAVVLDFNRIGLQSNQDFMYVYNGPSVNDALFTNGTITGNNNPGPTFTSTHPSGAITVEFTSDNIGVTYGWEATVNCGDSMGVSDLEKDFGVVVYPNPSSDWIHISSPKSKVKSASVHDLSGRLLIQNKLDVQEGKVNIASLPKGTYLLTLEIDGKKLTKKIVKK